MASLFGEPSGMTSMARPDRERPNGPDTRPRTSEVVRDFMVSELGPPFDVSWSCCCCHHGPGGFRGWCGLVWCDKCGVCVARCMHGVVFARCRNLLCVVFRSGDVQCVCGVHGVVRCWACVWCVYGVRCDVKHVRCMRGLVHV